MKFKPLCSALLMVGSFSLLGCGSGTTNNSNTPPATNVGQLFA